MIVVFDRQYPTLGVLGIEAVFEWQKPSPNLQIRDRSELEIGTCHSALESLSVYLRDITASASASVPTSWPVVSSSTMRSAS